MTVYPPPPVSVRLDGRRIRAYTPVLAQDGRVVGPAAPLLSRVADRAWIADGRLIVVRDGRRVSVLLLPPVPTRLDHTYVALGPLLRELGLNVTYDARSRVLDVRELPPEVATPTPFAPGAPQVAPNVVFTPTVTPTPRPVWTGSPLPRRTPLPFDEPLPEPTPSP